ncbi:hypothetical protein Q0F99_17895 [Rathayibacter oskolensis]|uniref:hypothetical protein n=1 Tax=Rathayibacter oskolensis TaxID=1891671 RepID=UPI00265FA1A3|nr:hypothetical protein [Rathayibacter oskolensis]WKK71299.1 hypothetical protein Q0F99_17895 [Rathayibacter oskolensis]
MDDPPADRDARMLLLIRSIASSERSDWAPRDVSVGEQHVVEDLDELDRTVQAPGARRSA